MSDLFPVSAVSEPKTIRLRDRDVAYLLKRSQQRRSIVLSVDQHGLTVSAPWRSSERRIAGIIRDAEAWVLRKLEAWSALPARTLSWAHGDTLKYLGRDLRLHLREAPAAAQASLHDECRLEVAVSAPGHAESIRAAVIKWYRAHAHAHFSDRMREFAPRFGLAVPRLILSAARTRWGSCNVNGEIRLNWRLIQATQPTIDYVVVHELAHLIEMNHSRRFWKHVAAQCPHYRDACDELNKMGVYYMDI